MYSLAMIYDRLFGELLWIHLDLKRSMSAAIAVFLDVDYDELFRIQFIQLQHLHNHEFVIVDDDPENHN
jgi:hypothetical protein